jgi:autotransporter-associated beta strand protein
MKSAGFLRLAAGTALAVSLSLKTATAGSATWNAGPVDNDWSNPANWTPATVPNGPNDIATFGMSSTTNVSVTSSIKVDSIVFTPGASAFIITPIPGQRTTTLTITGAGITNNSGITQNFVTYGSETSSSIIQFRGSATAGSGTALTNNAGSELYNQGATYFFDNTTAGTALLINNGGYYSGQTIFNDNSTAGDATIIANGSDQGAGSTWFELSASPGNATLIANGGANAGGFILLKSPGSDTTRVGAYSNGSFRTSYDYDSTVGSIEGDGTIILAISYHLTVGGDLSTAFSGVIEDDPYPPVMLGSNGSDRIQKVGGSLRKSGAATLTLSGINTYSGGTTVLSGTLKVTNTDGSATGTGAVSVQAGFLAGGGTIKGPVTIGKGSGTGASLAPGKGASKPTTLTLQSSLAFKADGNYTYKLNTKKAKADQVVANDVTIESGAQFDLNVIANMSLATGTVFTAISNTAARPIDGTFANLADGSILTAGHNKLLVSYTGGDGNDLTLTVQ